MVGHAILRLVVGSDLLGAVAVTYLREAVGALLGLLSLARHCGEDFNVGCRLLVLIRASDDVTGAETLQPLSVFRRPFGAAGGKIRTRIFDKPFHSLICCRLVLSFKRPF